MGLLGQMVRLFAIRSGVTSIDPTDRSALCWKRRKFPNGTALNAAAPPGILASAALEVLVKAV